MNQPEFMKRPVSVGGEEYALLLRDIKERYRKSRMKAAVKVNTALLEFYWGLGHDILALHTDAKWGSAFFDCLSLDLKAEFPGQTGFSVTNLKYAKRWYEFYNQTDSIRHQPGDEIEMPLDFGFVPWKHHIAIFTHSKSLDEAQFYIEETIRNGWSRAELSAEIENKLYQKKGRALTNFDLQLPQPHGELAKAILKSPYDFSFTGLDNKATEKQLEDVISQNITRLLLELGSGFAYVGRQMELRMPGGQTFIPDMIFYHTRLKCYIVVELKVVPFIPDFAGKLNFYVSAVDELMKQSDDNQTIGLLICKSKDDTVVEWSFRGLDRPLGVAEYELRKELGNVARYLPSEIELQRMIDTYDNI